MSTKSAGKVYNVLNSYLGKVRNFQVNIIQYFREPVARFVSSYNYMEKWRKEPLDTFARKVEIG